jgi:hypothetical protein
LVEINRRNKEHSVRAAYFFLHVRKPVVNNTAAFSKAIAPACVKTPNLAPNNAYKSHKFVELHPDFRVLTQAGPNPSCR